MRAFQKTGFAVLGLAAALNGCGTYVPGIQEFPGTADDGALLVKAIAESVHCQIQGAVKYLVEQDKEAAKLYGIRTAGWFERWGVQYALTLTVEEASSANPNLVWSPPSAMSSVFTLGAGAGISATASRQMTMNFFYPVKNLLDAPQCPPVTEAKYKAKSFLVRDNLGLQEPLVSYALVAGTGAGTVPLNTKTPLENEAFTDEVKFQIVTSAAINPAWELSRLDINQDGALLGASRDRTHQLLITYGPIDPETRGLAGPASNTFLASQIGAAIGRDRL